MPFFILSRTVVKKRRWLNFTEFLLLLGSGAGAMASVATQQIFYTTAPLSLLVSVGLLNRKQFEHQAEKNATSLEDLDQRMFHNVNHLQEQVNALPSPESLTNFQRSVMAHNDRAIVRFSREIEKMNQQLEQRLQTIEPPDLSHLSHEIEQLNDQYAHLAVSFTNLTKQVKQLSSVSKIEAAEAQVAQLKTEVIQMQVNLETFRSESRATFSNLQDNVQQFDHRLRQLPPHADPQILQEQVTELTQVISELAPRRDLSAMDINLQALGERQQILSESVEVLRETLNQRLQALSGESAVGLSTAASSEAASDQTRQELKQLTVGLANLEQQLQSLQVQSFPQIELQQAVTGYLNEFQEKQQQQLSRLKKCADSLELQQKQVNFQLKHISPNLDTAALEQQVGVLSSRLETTENYVAEVERSLSELRPTNPAVASSAQTEWIVDLQPKSLLQREGKDAIPASQASRAALEKALEQAQERLILVWPWATQCELDESMIEKFQRLLTRQCHLEIGWCHLGDRRDDRFIRTISQRWGVESGQKRLLKNALNQLLPLKQTYPEHFKFKILGTDENFLVCDRTFAILGVQQLATNNTVFPELGMKLRTSDPLVLEELTKRFDDPVLDPQDVVAYFNRAATRHDLGDYWGAIADYTQVLCINPWDATVYNNRGLIWADLNESTPAITDFSDALRHEPAFAPYCNRGVIQLEQGNLQAAIADLNKAVQLNPQSPIAYFYRGTALQKLGDHSGAIEDYGEAIERSRNIALPYCYRGAAYQKIGDVRRAIADLEAASELLKAQNDSNNLTQVTRTLAKLKNSKKVQSVVATNTN